MLLHPAPDHELRCWAEADSLAIHLFSLSMTGTALAASSTQDSTNNLATERA